MMSLPSLCLLLAFAGLTSAATFVSQSASSSSGGGRGTRGGTAFTTSTRFNNRPATVTSFTTGTGQTSFGSGSFNSLGNRGAFRPVQVPRVRPFSFRPVTFPQVSVPRFQPQRQFFGSGVNTRFGGSNRFGGSTFGGTGFSSSNAGFNGIDTNRFFNRLSNQINQAFAANLKR